MNQKVKYKIYKQKSGSLIPLSLKKNIPFKVKRIFIIKGKKKFYRGDHAHFKCSQYLIPINGSMTVEYENYKKKNKVLLSFDKKKGLLISPKTWLKIKFNSNNSILMVFCDREYEFDDYIEDYKYFLRIINK